MKIYNLKKNCFIYLKYDTQKHILKLKYNRLEDKISR